MSFERQHCHSEPFTGFRVNSAKNLSEFVILSEAKNPSKKTFLYTLILRSPRLTQDDNFDPSVEDSLSIVILSASEESI